jgi:AbiV family abortive infection protein
MPDSFDERCLKSTKSLGLKYAAIDFMIDKNERIVFLEQKRIGYTKGDGFYDNKLKVFLIRATSIRYDLMANTQDKKRYPMRKKDMLEGMRLVLKLAKIRLDSSKLLLESSNPYDAFILYSFSYEEFGKALIMKEFIEENKDGLPLWLFTGRSSHEKKMHRAKVYLPFKCSHFTPWVKLLNPSNKTDTTAYKVWREKKVQTGTISRGAWTTGHFADTANISSEFDEITRMEFLYVNWDPRTNEWHTNADYSIDELKEAIMLLEKKLIGFAMQNAVTLE